jgi:hypothetical protein
VLKRFNGYSDVAKASISDNVLTLLTAYHDQLLFVFDSVVDGKTIDGKKADLKSMKSVLTGVKDAVDFIHKVIAATTTTTATVNTTSANNSSSSSSSSSSDGTDIANNKKRVLSNHNHHNEDDDNNIIISTVISTVKNTLSSKYVLQQIWKQLIVLLEWMSNHNSTTNHASLTQVHGMIMKSIDATIITIKSNTAMIDANEVMTINIVGTRDDHDDDDDHHHQHDNHVAKVQKKETKKAKKAKKDHKL